MILSRVQLWKAVHLSARVAVLTSVAICQSVYNETAFLTSPTKSELYLETFKCWMMQLCVVLSPYTHQFLPVHISERALTDPS